MNQIFARRCVAGMLAAAALLLLPGAARAQLSGACCLPDGTCVGPILDFECFSQNGVFNPGQECSAVDCLNGPTGACCADDLINGGVFCEGGLHEQDCLARPGGVWFGGQTCDEIPCGNFGACCAPDGTCQDDVFVFDCLGDFIPGGTCADSPCFVRLGACCFPDGSCIDGAEEDPCLIQGGRWIAGALCTDADVCVPPPVTGACCLGPMICVEGITLDDCAARGGDFYQEQPCFGSPCVPIPDPGACCLPDGTCALLIEINCVEEEDGIFFGEGSTCDGRDCSDPTCPCERDGDTAQVDVFDLLAYLAEWFDQNGMSSPGLSADFDGSGSVDVFDLLAYLACWFSAGAGRSCP